MADCRRSAEESFVMYCTTTWPLIRRRDCLGCSCRSAVILARLHRRHFLHPSISVSACLSVSFFRRLCARVTVLCLLVHVSDVRRCLHRHREAAYPQPRRLDKQQTVITYTRHRAALIWQRAFCQRFGWLFFLNEVRNCPKVDEIENGGIIVSFHSIRNVVDRYRWCGRNLRAK